MEKLKITSAVLGFAVGDALGVPVEFKTREYLRKNPVKDMIGFGTYNEPEGTWSDDTSMTIATIDSIINDETIDINSIADYFIKWYRNGEYTATDNVFDIGRATFQALAKYETKVAEAIECGGDGIYDNGNGSLMRMLPVIFYIYYQNINDDNEIYKIVNNVSSITHRHEISILGCYIYVKYAFGLLSGLDKYQSYEKIKESDYGKFSVEALNVYSRILQEDISKLDIDKIQSSGYVVHTLEAALWIFMNSEDYNNSILKAVNLGEDTDTVAACAGGLLGLYYGEENIKKTWIDTLKKADYIKNLCEKFENLFY